MVWTTVMRDCVICTIIDKPPARMAFWCWCDTPRDALVRSRGLNYVAAAFGLQMVFNQGILHDYSGNQTG